MSRVWLALVDESPADATSAAAAEEDGRFAGYLATWAQSAKPVRRALRVDPRIVDRDGEAAWVSLVLTPPGLKLPFDDLAVQEARRRALALGRADGLSALMLDSSHFEGAITVVRGEGARQRLDADPFARIFAPRVLRVEPGVLGGAPAPVGPAIERYGSANPWPTDRFTMPA